MFPLVRLQFDRHWHPVVWVGWRSSELWTGRSVSDRRNVRDIVESRRVGECGS